MFAQIVQFGRATGRSPLQKHCCTHQLVFHDTGIAKFLTKIG